MGTCVDRDISKCTFKRTYNNAGDVFLLSQYSEKLLTSLFHAVFGSCTCSSHSMPDGRCRAGDTEHKNLSSRRPHFLWTSPKSVGVQGNRGTSVQPERFSKSGADSSVL
mmetsp:Transcript_28659/g.62410  ORF Transcript_28659/g.62410 Transcript_28659/m.62410 type:complete len:109 (+) Transcript_28659:1761-2087(+)